MGIQLLIVPEDQVQVYARDDEGRAVTTNEDLPKLLARDLRNTGLSRPAFVHANPDRRLVLNTIDCWHFPDGGRLLLVAVFAAVGLPTLALLAITATAAAMRVTVVIGRARRPITGR